MKKMIVLKQPAYFALPMIIENCIQCPKWMKCKPSKALTAPQRFAMKTNSALNKAILKNCPLEDAP
ncbi:MAG TPA: hypothetical protein ENH82_17900 [bacterium]|nr:hypothetical protein [bacterium]